MNLGTQFGDPPIDEGTLCTDLCPDHRAQRLLDLVCLVRHCARPLPRNGS
jgi:hypothetical protein